MSHTAEGQFGGASRIVAVATRWRFAILAAVTGTTAILQHPRAGPEWNQYFVTGSELLFGVHHRYSMMPGGLHLYGERPDLQIGPLSFLVATPLRLIGSDHGVVAATVFMSLLVVGIIALLERTAGRVERHGLPADPVVVQLTVLVGGLVTVVAWAELSSAFTHLDDALMLAFAVVAMHAVVVRRPVWLGVAIGLAIAAKPVGLVLVPLVLALEPRARRIAAASATAVAAVAWMPFVLADVRTLSAGRPTVDVDDASVLRLFGVARDLGPVWVRPAQMVLALTVGALAVRVGRWSAVPLVALACRIALDPGVFPYYATGLVLAALAHDLLSSDEPRPLAAVATFLVFDVADSVIASPMARSVLRLAGVVAIVAWVLLGRSSAARPSWIGTVRRQ